MSLKVVWKSAQYSARTKLKIDQSCGCSTHMLLLCGSECWHTTECNLPRLPAFHTASLRNVHRICWPTQTVNKELLDQSKQEDRRTLVTRRRWRWLGHVLWKEGNSITRTVAIRWTPEGKRAAKDSVVQNCRGRAEGSWLTAGAPLSDWPKTGRCGGTALLP